MKRIENKKWDARKHAYGCGTDAFWRENSPGLRRGGLRKSQEVADRGPGRLAEVAGWLCRVASRLPCYWSSGGPSTAWPRLGGFWLTLGAFSGSFGVQFSIQKKRELKYDIL